VHGPAGFLAEEAAAGHHCCGALDLLNELVCSCGAGATTRKTKTVPEGQTWQEHCVSAVERFIREILNRRVPMLNRRVLILTSVVVALAITIATQSFAQHRGTEATPAGATQDSFTTSDAVPWKPIDPKKYPGLQIFAVGGNPSQGASEFLQKFPAGMDSGWHWHTAAYEGVVIQGKFTHTSKGGAPQTGGPGSVWSQPAGQVHDDKCEEGADCVIVVCFHGKLDFISVDSPYRYE
jgi:quercetin dioxygenase-like cupin family protein